jgi:thiol-disulfide isomerase/thioredoxin
VDAVARLVVVAVLVAAVLTVTAARRRSIERDRGRDGDWPALPERLRGAGPTWVIFTTPYCASCRPLHDAISRAHPGDTVIDLDVSDEPDVAASYAVQRAPTTVRAAGDGRIVARLAGADAVTDLLHAEAARL